MVTRGVNTAQHCSASADYETVADMSSNLMSRDHSFQQAVVVTEFRYQYKSHSIEGKMQSTF